MVTVWPQSFSGLWYADEYDKPVLTLPTPSECRRVSARPNQWLGRGRRCVTRVFLKPSVLVDLHVKGAGRAHGWPGALRLETDVRQQAHLPAGTRQWPRRVGVSSARGWRIHRTPTTDRSTTRRLRP